jgi:threonine dehydrogenase-like Zn-dependent dehydrogenase
LFGSPALDGGQAEFVRVPLADGTVLKVSEGLGREAVLMADIFPTGFYGAKEAFKGLGEERRKNATVVVVGCGPVGE